MDNAKTLDIQLTTVLENLKKLGDENNEQQPSLEKYIHGEISVLMDAEPSIQDHIIKNIPSDAKPNHQLSGSVVEGALMARCFQQKEDWREVEIDIMINLETIPQEASHLVEPVEDKPGFVHILLPSANESILNIMFAEKNLGEVKNVQNYLDQNSQYINPLLVKDFCYMDRELSLVDWYSDMYKQIMSIEKTETTVEQIALLGLYRMSSDYVPAIRLEFWPCQAENWIMRCRLWPPQATIENIVEKGCQVVPRSSPGGDVNTEWRLSFSGPEAILAQLRSKEQQQAYYFFKMFFYRYLKCVESSDPKGKQLYSYVIKTTMLWACEELPPEDPIWASFKKSVQVLLLKLLGSLETGFLPHYFIPEINLLERIGEDVRTKCAAIISRWQNNILMTVPFDMPEKREWILLISSLCLTWQDYMYDDIFASIRRSFPQR